MTTPVVQIDHRGAVSEIRLCREEVHNALDAAFPQGAASGERYSPELMKTVDKE